MAEFALGLGAGVILATLYWAWTPEPERIKTRCINCEVLEQMLHEEYERENSKC